MNKYGFRLLLLSGFSWLATAAPAGAQTGPATTAGADEDTAGVADIIVTAQKRSENINEVPIAISAATGDQLAQRGVTSVADLAKIVPGFQFANTNLNPVYTLRGVGFYDVTFSSRGTVALYNDEVALPFGVLAQGIGFDLERVEVLKGPQGTLFGQNSTGGAINYIAAKPQDSFHAGISGEYGRFNRSYVEAFATGPITGTLKARIAARQEFGSDWQRGFTNNDTHGNRSLISGRLLLDWAPSERLRMVLNLTSVHNDSEPQVPQLSGFYSIVGANGLPRPAELVGYPLPPHSARAADADLDKDYFQRDDMFLASLRAEYDLTDDLTLTSISGYTDYSRKGKRDADGVTAYNDYFINNASMKVYQQELRLGGKVADWLTFVTGLNYERDEASELAYPTFTQATIVNAFAGLVPGVPYLGAGARLTSRYTTKAAFGNVDAEVLRNVTLHAGVRLTRYSGSGTNCTFPDALNVVGRAFAMIYNSKRATLGLAPIAPIQPDECVTADVATFTPFRNGLPLSLKERNTSWRLVLDWKPTPGILLYGGVSKGYKGGSLPATIANYADQAAPATQESVLDYEAGFKASLFNRQLQINGAAFYYDYKDKQFLGRILIPLAGPVTRLLNIPTSSLKGAELQIDWQPSSHFRLGGGITYLDSKIAGNFVNFDAFGVQKTFSGEPFPFTPKWQGTADIEYRTDLDARRQVFAGASGQFQTATNAALGDRAELRLKPYQTLDLRLGIEDRANGWRAMLFGRNVTNSYYWNNAIRAVDTIVRYTGLPATYGVAFSYKY